MKTNGIKKERKQYETPRLIEMPKEDILVSSAGEYAGNKPVKPIGNGETFYE